MAKKKKTEESVSFKTGTQPVRVRADLAEMIVFMSDVQKKHTSEFIDPVIRPVILAMFAKYQDLYLATKKAREETQIGEVE